MADLGVRSLDEAVHSGRKLEISSNLGRILDSTFTPFTPPYAPMFNGSSNITIQGGTFILINGDISQADNETSQSTAVSVENHNCRTHVQDAEPFLHRLPSWEANAQIYSEPESYCPTVECHSTVNPGTSIRARSQCLAHDPCLIPMPTISSEGSLRDKIMSTHMPLSVDASGGNATPNNDSHHSVSKAILFLKTALRHARKIFSNFSRACTFPVCRAHPASSSSRLTMRMKLKLVHGHQ